MTDSVISEPAILFSADTILSDNTANKSLQKHCITLLTRSFKVFKLLHAAKAMQSPLKVACAHGVKKIEKEMR